MRAMRCDACLIALSTYLNGQYMSDCTKAERRSDLEIARARVESEALIFFFLFHYIV